MKKNEFESLLNEQFAELPFEEVFDKLIYLTSLKRGKHISEKTLKSKIANKKCGSLIRDYDPIAFFIAWGEYEQ